MDKVQLITIVITAVVSVVAKEVIIWLVSLFKGTSAAKTFAAKLRALFTKNNLEIAGSLLALIFYIGVLINFALAEAPPTRLEILLIIGAVFAILFVGLNLLFEIAKAQVNKTKNAA